MADKKSLKVIVPDEVRNGSACTRVTGGLTDEEVKILERMRWLKEEMGALQKDADSESPPADAAARMEAMKAQLADLKGERDAARRRRMALLGYDEED